MNYTPVGGTPVTLNVRYQNGSGGWYNNIGLVVENTSYDNGSGILQPLTAGYYAKHSLYTVGQGTYETYILFISQVTIFISLISPNKEIFQHLLLILSIQ